jgi:hypothetical protein
MAGFPNTAVVLCQVPHTFTPPCHLQTLAINCHHHPTLTLACASVFIAACNPHSIGLPCLPRTVVDPGCLASANIACPSFGACPSIACGDPGRPVQLPQEARAAAAAQAIATITPLGVVCHTHSPGCGGGPDLPMRHAMPTITPQGHVCNTYPPACGGGPDQLPRMQAIATITPLGQVCHTHTPGCGGGGHTLMQAFPTITPLGHVCNTHTPGCGGGGHTMMQAFPSLFGGPLCSTSAAICDPHTLATFMPTQVACATWFACPPGGRY